jgi:hypothetical protein
VDVRIGIIQSPRELEVELGEDVDREVLLAEIGKVLAEPQAVLWLTDKRGKRVGVPSARLAFIEVGTGSEERRVGFGAP